MRLTLLLAAAVILIHDPTGKWANDPLRPWFRPLIASLVFCAVSATANVPPEVREWFEHLRSPNGVPCCSYAAIAMDRGQFGEGINTGPKYSILCFVPSDGV